VPLDSTLAAFFLHTATARPGERLLVAFSGGGDSTALLLALARLAPARGWRLQAAHLDHGLDPGSALRAENAAALAAALGVRCVVARRRVRRQPGESVEEAARRVRYRFLESLRRRLGARYVVTAHHADDQAETVLLRLLYGSGLAGLAGIRPVNGNVVRPLLGMRRAELRAAVLAAGLSPLVDPTNDDLRLARNRVRRHLLPLLEAAEGDEPPLADRLASLAARAAGAAAEVERRLLERLRPWPVEGGLGTASTALAGLPAPLQAPAVSLLHRRAGAALPPSRAARAALLRGLAAGALWGGDAGGGYRWTRSGPSLFVSRPPAEVAYFTYTFTVPGEVEIPELDLRMRLVRAAVEPWMFRGARLRAGLALPLQPGGAVVVRGRRLGDRLRPLGGPGTRRLKDVLIDRRVPRPERDRLPLLCVGERIAWVPGVTVAEEFRLHRDQTKAWVAEIEPR
jgi:tRNA(Ile)-lysidine synthase